MELKQIPTEQITANPEQPRETFEREKLRELSDSIKEIGLINPITVRKKGKQYEIVAGERRWRAHQIAKIKNIPALVKEYKSEGQVAVESLIENIHREDLTPQEKGKFLLQIMKTEKIKNHHQLSKRVKITHHSISDWIDSYEFTKSTPGSGNISHKIIRSTRGMEDKERKKIIEFTEKQKMSGTKVEEEFVPIYKKSSQEIKDALLDDKITTEQAENLTKISSDKAREKALKETTQHNRLANITPKIMVNAKPELTDALRKKFNSSQKIIYNNLHDARVSVIKANKFISKTNQMLSALMQRQFEYGDEKTLKSTMTQMKSIFDEINKFNIIIESFEELKEQFIERMENKDDGC